jgi:outer membrane biosynthesis protein TonB
MVSKITRAGSFVLGVASLAALAAPTLLGTSVQAQMAPMGPTDTAPTPTTPPVNQTPRPEVETEPMQQPEMQQPEMQQQQFETDGVQGVPSNLQAERQSECDRAPVALGPYTSFLYTQQYNCFPFYRLRT